MFATRVIGAFGEPRNFENTRIGGATRLHPVISTALAQYRARPASDAEDVLHGSYAHCAGDGSEWSCVKLRIERIG